MPDTLCTKTPRQPALLPDAYAMISGRAVRRAAIFPVFRAAGRSAPMMGIARSTLSRRTILVLFVLLGASPAASSATLEDSARELARKISSALPAQGEVAFEVHKLSSIGADEFASIEQSLKNEMRNEGVRFVQSGGATISVDVTLSESVSSFVWTAKIRQGDSSQFVLMTVPLSSQNRARSSGMPIAIHGEKFWEGPQRVLDATIADAPNGATLLLLLTPDALVIRQVGGDATSSVPIPRVEPVTRDPSGFLAQSGNSFTANFPSQICSIDIADGLLIECHLAGGPAPGRVFESLILLLGSPGPAHVDRGSQIAAVPSSCGGRLLSLAAGLGDYTEPDKILLFESTVANGIITEKPVSDFIHFPGPVLSIQSGGDPPRAIVRNLQTGNYEAYRIFISCAQ